MAKTKDTEIKVVARNRKAHMKFAVLEAYEAGIALQGHEVKSLRQGRSNIEDGFVRLDKGELWLFNAYIPPYTHLSNTGSVYEPTRTRKLLMHRKEINKLENQVMVKGLTLIPLELYFKRGKVKVAVGLAKGKLAHDRRDELKKRDTDREIRRNLGSKRG